MVAGRGFQPFKLVAGELEIETIVKDVAIYMAAFERNVETVHLHRFAVWLDMHLKMGRDRIDISGEFDQAAVHGFQPAFVFAQVINKLSKLGLVQRGFGKVIDFIFMILFAGEAGSANVLETAGAGLAFFEDMAAPEEFDASFAVAAFDTEDMVRRDLVAELLVCGMAADEYSCRFVQIADYGCHKIKYNDYVWHIKDRIHGRLRATRKPV
jgi:hypothetical protein